MLPETQRIVITGFGMVSPLGLDVPTSWAAIKAGQSGVDYITAFDASEFRVRFAAEVKGFDPQKYMDKQTVRRLDRFLHLAVGAAQEAMAHSGFDMHACDTRRVGVMIGSGIGGVHTILEQQDVFREKGPRRVSPFGVPALMLNSASGYVSIMIGARGPNLAFATACATGTHAIGEAARIIRRGDADMVVAGGSEAPLVPMACAAFENMGAVSLRNEDPKGASRPFDAGRDGFVMAEGAGVLILERLDLARARGATCYAEVVGAANTADAYHITAPAENGEGAAECIRLALQSAGLAPDAIGYINAHGTSTSLGDIAETIAIKEVFGDHAYRLAVSSTKSMSGHLMGAAGAVEAIWTALALHEQILPPTINLTSADPACDLDYVPNVARPASFDVAMSNSFGFGGHNGTVILARCD